MYTSSVEVEHHGKDDKYYIMKFTATSGSISIEFTVHEPQLTSYDTWVKFATTEKASIGLYSGSGGCISDMTKRDGKITFNSEEDGCGNDTSQSMTVDADLFDQKLLECVNKLHADGLLK